MGVYEIKNDSGYINLKIFNVPVSPLAFGLDPVFNKENVFCIKKAMPSLKVCHGMKNVSDMSCLQNTVQHTWHTPGDENCYETFIHHKDCLLILPFSNKSESCDKCSHATYRLTQKRKKTAMDSSVSAKHRRDSSDPCSTEQYTEECTTNYISEDTDQSNNDSDQSKNDTDQSRNDTDQSKISGKTLTIDLDQGSASIMEQVLQAVIPDAPPEMRKHLSAQVGNISQQKSTSRRWDINIIRTCLSLWARSPRGYEDLRKSKLLILPCPTTLRYYKNCVDQKPGLNKDNLKSNIILNKLQ